MAQASSYPTGTSVIVSDQPNIFPTTICVGLSSVDDGSMKDGTKLLTSSATRNRETFLANLNMPTQRAAIFAASFDSDDYCRYQLAIPGVSIGVDALATDEVDQPILVPLADCTGAVLYDPEHHALMVSHLGRHSTEQFGGEKSVKYMQGKFGTDPAKLLVWLSPSPNGTDYPLWAFDDRSFNSVLTEQFVMAGVKSENIEASIVDTVTNPNYFSHSQFLRGQQSIDGRYAIAAMLQNS